jgi:hypothetical protein
MKALIAAAIGVAAVIRTPVLAQTTTPTSNTLSNSKKAGRRYLTTAPRA